MDDKAPFFDSGGSLLRFFVVAVFTLWLSAHAARADCTNPSQPAGFEFYNADSNVLVYCDGTNWIAYPKSATSIPGPTGCPVIGDVCSDGTVNAGMSPDGGVNMYTTAGAGSSLAWAINSVISLAGASSDMSGKGNTDALIAAGGTDYPAASLCHQLVAGGRDDWYLPAPDELVVLCQNSAAIGIPPSIHWTSKEIGYVADPVDRMSAAVVDFAGCAIQTSWASSDVVRCVRKQADGCSDPPAPAGGVMFNGDHRVLQWCDGATWHAAGPIAPGGPNAGCANPPATAGTMIFNLDYSVLQYCDGDIWHAIGKQIIVSDPCAGSPNPGDVCADGSVYAGLSPDGNAKMFTTPADAGTSSWNSGTATWIDTAMANNSYATGAANTALLAGLSDAASPYNAAVYCDNLSAHGHQDWYLPARDELDVMYDNHAAIGGFVTGGAFYWSSSESNDNGAVAQRFNDGGQSAFASKNGSLRVRCSRR
jgi:hypothetical protein